MLRFFCVQYVQKRDFNVLSWFLGPVLATIGFKNTHLTSTLRKIWNLGGKNQIPKIRACTATWPDHSLHHTFSNVNALVKSEATASNVRFVQWLPDFRPFHLFKWQFRLFSFTNAMDDFVSDAMPLRLSLKDSIRHSPQFFCILCFSYCSRNGMSIPFWFFFLSWPNVLKYFFLFYSTYIS